MNTHNINEQDKFTNFIKETKELAEKSKTGVDIDLAIKFRLTIILQDINKNLEKLVGKN